VGKTVSDKTAAGLVRAFLSRRADSTRRAYRKDLADFAEWMGELSDADAMDRLVSWGAGPANAAVLDYKAALVERGLAPATINRRLSTIRSCMKMARMIGLADFTIEVEGERRKAIRDNKGPGLPRVREIIGELRGKIDAGSCQAVRDLAIVRLMFNQGLGRGEVVLLDTADYDGRKLRVHGSARRSPEWLTLTPASIDALDAWIVTRGDWQGPLFCPTVKVSPKHDNGGRLDAMSVYRMLARYGIRPHGLQRSGSTIVSLLTGGDVFAVREHGRLASIESAAKRVDRDGDEYAKAARTLDAIEAERV
jgi:integrase/recombinase XerC